MTFSSLIKIILDVFDRIKNVIQFGFQKDQLKILGGINSSHTKF